MSEDGPPPLFDTVDITTRDVDDEEEDDDDFDDDLFASAVAVNKQCSLK